MLHTVQYKKKSYKTFIHLNLISGHGLHFKLILTDKGSSNSKTSILTYYEPMTSAWMFNQNLARSNYANKENGMQSLNWPNQGTWNFQVYICSNISLLENKNI